MEVAEGSSRRGKNFLNLSTYKSDWLRIKTLLDMGIGFFLNPDSSWTKDSPELLAFWEKGKGKDRFVRIKWEQNPVKYLGKVLESLDVKTTCTKPRTSEGRIRLYSLNQVYLATPERQALLSCVEERIKERAEKARENINWNYLQTQIQQGVEGGTQAADEYINNKDVACVPDEAREGGIPQAIAELVEAFAFCTEDYQFALVAEDYEPEDVEVAISLIDSAPLRHRVRSWWESTEIGARVSYRSLGMVN